MTENQISALKKVQTLKTKLADSNAREAALEAEVHRLQSGIAQLMDSSEQSKYLLKETIGELNKRVKALLIECFTKDTQLQQYEGWIYNTDQLTEGLRLKDEEIARLKTARDTLKGWFDECKGSANDHIDELKADFEKSSAVAQERINRLSAELVKEKGKPDIRLVGAKQRITELEAALNYFNGLCQQGAPDLAANWRAKVANLQAELANLELKLKARDHQIVLLNSGLEREIRKTFKLSEELHESTLSKVWNWLTFKS